MEKLHVKIRTLQISEIKNSDSDSILASAVICDGQGLDFCVVVELKTGLGLRQELVEITC
jgi:hypothetical protein